MARDVMKRSLAGVLAIAFGCAGPTLQQTLDEADRRLDWGEYGAAIEGYTEALERDPSCVRAWNNRGLAKYRSGDHVGAVADYGEALRSGTPLAETHYNRGVAYLGLRDPLRALADFSDALRFQPDHYRALAGRGLARARQGDRPAAAADLARSLELGPGDWNERAAVEAELRKLQESK